MKYFKKTWINGSYEPKSWNFWGHNGATTNNYNEGYNNKFNNSLNLHGHPNPYTLCKVIKDELLNAENDDRAAKVKPNTKAAASRAGKRTQLLERKKYLMKQYERTQDLEQFIKSLGHNCMVYDQRISHSIHDLTFDVEKECDSNSQIDSADDLDQTDSIIEQFPQKSLIGDDLRKKRRENVEITFSDKSVSEEVIAPPKNLPKNGMSLTQGFIYTRRRLNLIGFIPSPSQPKTKGQGI